MSGIYPTYGAARDDWHYDPGCRRPDDPTWPAPTYAGCDYCVYPTPGARVAWVRWRLARWIVRWSGRVARVLAPRYPTWVGGAGGAKVPTDLKRFDGGDL